MAKRYRYAFARQKEAEEGCLATVLAGVSVVLFVIALVISCVSGGKGAAGPVMGGMSVCAALLSVYGFIQGIRGLSHENRSHTYSKAGAVANGIIMIGWLGLYLMGV